MTNLVSLMNDERARVTSTAFRSSMNQLAQVFSTKASNVASGTVPRVYYSRDVSLQVASVSQALITTSFGTETPLGIIKNPEKEYEVAKIRFYETKLFQDIVGPLKFLPTPKVRSLTGKCQVSRDFKSVLLTDSANKLNYLMLPIQRLLFQESVTSTSFILVPASMVMSDSFVTTMIFRDFTRSVDMSRDLTDYDLASSKTSGISATYAEIKRRYVHEFNQRVTKGFSHNPIDSNPRGELDLKGTHEVTPFLDKTPRLDANLSSLVGSTDQIVLVSSLHIDGRDYDDVRLIDLGTNPRPGIPTEYSLHFEDSIINWYKNIYSVAGSYLADQSVSITSRYKVSALLDASFSTAFKRTFPGHEIPKTTSVTVPRMQADIIKVGPLTLTGVVVPSMIMLSNFETRLVQKPVRLICLTFPKLFTRLDDLGKKQDVPVRIDRRASNRKGYANG